MSSYHGSGDDDGGRYIDPDAGPPKIKHRAEQEKYLAEQIIRLNDREQEYLKRIAELEQRLKVSQDQIDKLMGHIAERSLYQHDKSCSAYQPRGLPCTCGAVRR